MRVSLSFFNASYFHNQIAFWGIGLVKFYTFINFCIFSLDSPNIIFDSLLKIYYIFGIFAIVDIVLFLTILALIRNAYEYS